MYIIKISIESFHFAVTVRSVYLSLQRPGNENNQCTRILMITWALQPPPPPHVYHVPRERECHRCVNDCSLACVFLVSCGFTFRIRCHLLTLGTRHKLLGCSFHQEWTHIYGMCRPRIQLNKNKELLHKQSLNRKYFLVSKLNFCFDYFRS